MNFSDRPVGSLSGEGVKQFHETRLVRITHGGLASSFCFSFFLPED